MSSPSPNTFSARGRQRGGTFSVKLRALVLQGYNPFLITLEGDEKFPEFYIDCESDEDGCLFIQIGGPTVRPIH